LLPHHLFAETLLPRKRKKKRTRLCCSRVCSAEACVDNLVRRFSSGGGDGESVLVLSWCAAYLLQELHRFFSL